MQHQIGGEAEASDEQTGQDDEDGDVVEGETEEPVEVPRLDPRWNATTDGC
jgi:hypothetical protein